jgi:polysaccharide pyruvyl transferase WcaK-like protein
MRHVLLAGRFDTDDPSSGARLHAFADALDGVALSTTAPPSLSDPLAVASVGHTRRALVRAITDCDVVVVAGGDAFDDMSRTQLTPPVVHTAELVALARTRRRPIALVGVGAERLDRRSAKALARLVVRSADLLVVRDEPSATLLNRAGAILPVRVAADPVWCGLRSPLAPTERDGVVVVVDAAAVSPVVVAELSAAIARTPSMGVSVQPWRESDVSSAVLLADMLPAPARVLPPLRTLDAAMRAFATFEAVVSMHEHGLMAAAAASTPSVALGTRASLAAIAHRLEHELVDRPVGARGLAEVLERARGSRQSLAAVRRERALADGSMALLRLLVNSGDAPELAAIDGLTLSDGRSAR